MLVYPSSPKLHPHLSSIASPTIDMKTRLCAFVVFALAFCCSAVAQDKPAPKKTVRLFTIGNSFSQDATFFLDDLALADGNLLIQKGAVVGGSPLELHWNRAQLNEKDPADKNGHYTASKGLKELLGEDKYDFVTIQQASMKSHDIATYRPFAANLRDYVK